MRNSLIVLQILISAISVAQTKDFLDREMTPCDSLSASYYQIMQDIKNTNLVKCEVYTMTDTLYQKGYYESQKDLLKSGTWLRYYASGQIRSKRTFSSGRLVGTSTYYHPNGQISEQIRVKQSGPPGSIPSIQQQYSKDGTHNIVDGNGWYNGETKFNIGVLSDSISGKYRDGNPIGVWRAYYRGMLVLQEEYSATGLVKGFVSRDGKKIKYDKIYTPADYQMSRKKFSLLWRRNLKYYLTYSESKETDYKIQMLLRLFIDEYGNMTDITIENGVDKADMAAAIKAIRRTVKKWNPARLRGIPVSSKVTIPINLESRLF